MILLRKLSKVYGFVAVILCVCPGVVRGQGTISPQIYATVLDASGNPVSGACIWTTVAGTSTPVSTFTDSTLATPNTNPIKADTAGRYVAFLTPGASYKFVVESSCVAPAHGTVIRTQDNITAVAANNQAGDIIGTAGETLAAGKVVYLSDGGGGKTAGRWYLADSSNVLFAFRAGMGMTPSAISSGVSGTIRQTGTVTGLAGLTAGTVYYLGSSGALLTAPPGGVLNVRVGQADSSTSLVLDGPQARVPYTVVLANAVNAVVANTSVQTQILNASIPANTMGTYRAVRITITGLYTNAGAGASTFSLAASYGGQAFVSASAGSFATGTTGPFSMVSILNATGPTAQTAETVITVPTSGVVQAANAISAASVLQSYNDALTVNSATAQSLIVAVTHSLGAGVTFQMFSATVELIGQ